MGWKKLPVSQGKASGNAKSKRSTKMEASMRKPVPALLNIALGFHCQSGANGIKPVEHHQIITRECTEIDREGRHRIIKKGGVAPEQGPEEISLPLLIDAEYRDTGSHFVTEK